MEEDIKILEELIKHNYLEDVGYLREDNDYEKFNQAIENLIKGYRELEEFKKQVTDIESTNFIKYKNYIPKSKIKEKIEEQLKEADDVLINNNYLDNFNGSKENQKYYYDGYKDSALFLQELLEETTQRIQKPKPPEIKLNKGLYETFSKKKEKE